MTSPGTHFGLYRHAEVFHSTTLISSLNPSATAAWIAIGRTSRVRSKAHRAHWMTSLSKDAPLKPAIGPPRPYLTAHRHITPGAPVAGVVSRETVTAPPAYVRWRPSCSTLVRYLPSSWEAHSTAAALHSMPVLPAVTPGAPQSSRKNHHGRVYVGSPLWFPFSWIGNVLPMVSAGWGTFHVKHGRPQRRARAWSPRLTAHRTLAAHAPRDFRILQLPIGDKGALGRGRVYGDK